MPAEGIHEIGRRGAIEAVDLLWRILGDRIRLPFNAYDHAEKLAFDHGLPSGVAPFNFDLKGNLERSVPGRVGGVEAVEVFVEVKKYHEGDSLLPEFAKFLQRAAIVASVPAHKATWFFFVSNVPFGSSKGIRLCNGEYLAECSAPWPEPLKRNLSHLQDRIVVIIGTESFARLLQQWGRDA
jgi:hypothetical protein